MARRAPGRASQGRARALTPSQRRRVRRRPVVDIGRDERGRRKQLTRTFDTRREAREDGSKYITGVCQDVTEARASEAELARSIAVLETTLEATGDGIIVTDTEGNTVSWNLGTLEAGATANATITVKAIAEGTHENCADVHADSNLSDHACCRTTVTAPQLKLELVCDAPGLTCKELCSTVTVISPSLSR